MKKVFSRAEESTAPKERLLSDLLASIGLLQSRSAPRLCKSSDGQVLVEVHMDGLHACGPTVDLVRIGELIKGKKLSVSYSHEYGSTAKHQHMRRERIMTEGGSYIKPNPKYLEAAAELLRLTDSKAVATPPASGDRADSELESPKLVKGKPYFTCSCV